MGTTYARAAEDILDRIFRRVEKPSPQAQAEEAINHPKSLVYVAMSNRSFYWRAHIQQYVLDQGSVPISPFMLFDYYLLHTVSKQVVREAMNNLIVRCDEMWVFGPISLGVKVQIGIARRVGRPVRFFDIAELPSAILPIPEERAKEEHREF